MMGWVVFNEESKKYGLVGRSEDGAVVIPSVGFIPKANELWLCEIEKKKNCYIARGIAKWNIVGGGDEDES